MYCVIVGDIINSKEIVDPDKREAVLYAAKGVFSSINAKYRDAILADFGVVRGDGFEGVLMAKHLAPKIIQEIIKGFYLADKTRVRIAAVVGELSAVSSDRNETDGPAFHKALECLKKVKARKSEHWLQVAIETGQPAQPLIESLLGLLSALTGDWTDRQYEIVRAMEAYDLSTVVAKKLEIKPSVVSKQLKAANYEEYSRAWESLEEYFLLADEASIALADAANIAEASPADYLAYYNVALNQYKKKKYDLAVSLFRTALDRVKQEFGEEDIRLIKYYNMLAVALAAGGIYTEAEETLETSFNLQHDLPKASNLYVATLLVSSNLAWRAEKYTKARELLENALVLAESFLEKDDDTIVTIKELLETFTVYYGQH